MPGILFWKQLFWKEKIKWDDDEFVWMVQCLGWKLYTCLIFRVRYHAARGLIYLGCFDVGGIYLFKRVPGKTMRRDRTVIRDKEWWCCVVWAVNQLSDDFGDWLWRSGERARFFPLNYEILAVKRCFRPVLCDARLKRISRYGKRIELDNQKLSFSLRKANNCRNLLLSSSLNQVLWGPCGILPLIFT